MSSIGHLVPVICFCLPVVVCVLSSDSVQAVEWGEVQKLKAKYVRQVAEHAIDQQVKTSAAPVPIPFPDAVEAAGEMKVTGHNAEALSLDVQAAPRLDGVPAADFVRFSLPQPVDMLKDHSGLAFTVKTEKGSSPEVRIGCRLITPDGKRAVMLPTIPVLNNWGQNPHEIYFDWAHINFADIQDAIDVLRAVQTVELTVASRLRTPRRGASESPQPAAFTISDFRLVDYMKGSFDLSRNNWEATGRPDLTLQHRVQECTGIVAIFGGEAGLRAAVDALDMCLRTQCWDGSFLDGRRGARTVVSAEYTLGFTLYGMVPAYKALEDARSPALDETITVGPVSKTRREFYQDMFYRAALSRGILPPSTFLDDIIGGDKMMTGANRVEGFATAMRMICEILTDPAREKQVRKLTEAFMDDMAAAQGKYSGGFPLLGEGGRYGERGIHYDAGYITSQMKRICAGLKAAPDPRVVKMLERYQDVFEATMDKTGTGLVRLISERTGGSGPATLSTADSAAQVGLKYNLPIVAQWGYNCHARSWDGTEDELRNTWVSFSRSTGYALGTFVSVLLHDMDPEPQPRDLGYLFPRQFPVWSSRLYTKDGELQRTSRMIIRPEGPQVSDFWIEVGEYPKTVGVPVLVESPDGRVDAVAVSLSGWPKLLPADATVEISGDVSARGKLGEPFTFTLKKTTRIVVTGPKVTLPPEAGGKRVPFRAELTLTPAKPMQKVRLTVLRGTQDYDLTFTPPHVLDGLPSGADVALWRNGATIADINRRSRGFERVIDGDAESQGIVRELAGLSFRVQLTQAFALDRIVLSQAQRGEGVLARPKDVVVTPHGGAPVRLTLEDRPLEVQTFPLKGVQADSVEIEVETVYPSSQEGETSGGFATIQILKR